MKSLKGITLVGLVTFAIFSFALGVPANTESANIANWTLMFYLNGDCNLDKDIVELIDEMELIGPPPKVNVLVLLDRKNWSYGDSEKVPKNGWSKARIYNLLQDNAPARINSPVLKNLGEVNMCKSRTLTKFLTLSIKNFPAKHYALIFHMHGSGLDMGSDDSADDDDLTLDELKTSLEKIKKTGIKLDIINFYSCLMGTFEAAFAIKDYTKIMVASPTTLKRYPSDMYTGGYHFLLRDLAANSDIKPVELARKIIENSIRGDEFYGHGRQLIGLDLSTLPEVETAFSELNKSLISFLNSDEKSITRLSAIDIPRAGSDSGFDKIILSQWLSGLTKKIENSEVQQKAKELSGILDRISIKDKENTQSFAVYFPYKRDYSFYTWASMKLKDYQKLDFAKVTEWGRFLKEVGLAKNKYQPGYQPSTASQESPSSWSKTREILVDYLPLWIILGFGVVLPLTFAGVIAHLEHLKDREDAQKASVPRTFEKLISHKQEECKECASVGYYWREYTDGVVIHRELNENGLLFVATPHPLPSELDENHFILMNLSSEKKGTFGSFSSIVNLRIGDIVAVEGFVKAEKEFYYLDLGKATRTGHIDVSKDLIEAAKEKVENL